MQRILLTFLIIITSFHVYCQVGIKGYNIGEIAPDDLKFNHPSPSEIQTTVGGIEGTLYIYTTEDKKEIYDIAFGMKTGFGLYYGINKYKALQFIDDLSNHFGIKLEEGPLTYSTLELGPGIFRKYTGNIPDEKYIHINVGIEDVRYKEKSKKGKKDYGH